MIGRYFGYRQGRIHPFSAPNRAQSPNATPSNINPSQEKDLLQQLGHKGETL